MDRRVDPRACIEHTLLRAEAVPAEIERLCDEAAEHALLAVCVNPIYVKRAAARLQGTAVRVVTVVGFPLGASVVRSDTIAASEALADGAAEIDMVIPIGLALGGDLGAVSARVSALRDATRGAVLKVILECGHFDAAGLRAVAEAALSAGPDFLKTSTGFGPRGASTDDIRLLKEVCRGRAELKASGGVRNYEAARQLLAAGATRVGTSNGAAIMREFLAAP